MTLQDDFNSSIIGKRRRGTWDDPFKSFSVTLPIINGKTTLPEIPNRFEKVKVSGYTSPLYEVEDGELTETTYKIDYQNGVVFFNTIHNNRNFLFEFQGEGQHFFPSNGIWVTQDDNGDIQTAKDKFDSLDSDIASQKSRVDVQISSVPQPSEILDMRVDKNGIVYPVAKNRIDAEQKKIEDAYKSINGTTYGSLKERLDAQDTNMGDVGVLITNSKKVVNAINEVNTNAQTFANTAQTNATNFAKQYGLGSQLSTYRITGNLNSSTSGGFFYVDPSATNKPLETAGFLIVIAKDNSYVSQLFIDDGTGVIYTRTLNNSSWGTWKTIQVSDITTYSGGVKINITDKTKDFLQEVVNTGVGLSTFYAITGTANLPSTTSARGMVHLTNSTNGWVYATDSNNNVFTNYYNNGSWKGWQQLLDSRSSVLGSGERIEIVELNFAGGSHTMTSSGNFAKAFSVAPTVVPAHVSQAISYMDVMCYPNIYNITTTGFSCSLNVANPPDKFGSGTGKMKFFVFGK